MTLADVIAQLKANEAAIRTMGIERLYLFGSHSRDAAGPASDVDLFFDQIPNRKLGLIDLIGMENRLADLLGIEVDLMTRSSLHPLLRDDIEREAVRVI